MGDTGRSVLEIYLLCIYCLANVLARLKATNRGKLLCLGPQVVALIISLPGHFSSGKLSTKRSIVPRLIQY